MSAERRQFIHNAGVLSLAAVLPSAARGQADSTMTTTTKDTKNGRGKNNWTCVLVLDRAQRPVSGSSEALVGAIRRGADLRIGTEFRHNEHIDPKSTDPELIQEVADFRVTYLLEDRWAAGIMNLRQPISLPDGFGPRPSMSFFMYNQDGWQAIARPHLDGESNSGKIGPAPVDDHRDMPKYHQFDSWDAGTNAPSSNFVYDFETIQYWVCNDWEEVFSHTADGKVVAGSFDSLTTEFALGRDVKVGIDGLCVDLAEDPAHAIRHEMFVQCGPGYCYTGRKLFMAESQPIVRVGPGIPMRYRSKGWDFGWLMPRTDGFVARRLFDPYTLKGQDSHGRHAIRWFVR